jgi:hypothetical protein
MIIQVDSERVRLLEPDVMTDFRVEADAESGAFDLDVALQAFGGGRYDGDHAWIRIDWIRAEASGVAALDWHHHFDRMLEYAGTRGWLSDDGQQVRGHVDQRK